MLNTDRFSFSSFFLDNATNSMDIGDFDSMDDDWLA